MVYAIVQQGLLIDCIQEVNNAEFDNPEARRYFQTECRKSAEEIVQFIISLRKENFKEFWLPCMSIHELPVLHEYS